MKILYVCNDLAYFDAHRRALADEAKARGHDVIIACGAAEHAVDGHVDVKLDMPRHRFDLRRDMALAQMIAQLAKATKADIVHLITIKPILFGAIGLRLFAPQVRVVATFPGLGRVFEQSPTSAKERLRRLLVIRGLRFGLAPARVRTIFETEADRATLHGHDIGHPGRSFHIPGAGVDPAVYPRKPLPALPLRLLHAGRLLKLKGVLEFARAAELVRDAGLDVRFLLAGQQQSGDPDALSDEEFHAVSSGHAVEFLGNRPASEMPAILASVHAVVLPTRYQEGVPRILIEAGSVGRPAIVSDNPGCRAFVDDGQNGIVLSQPTAEHIAQAVATLAADPAMLQRMADAAVARFIDGSFAAAKVATRTLALYEAP